MGCVTSITDPVKIRIKKPCRGYYLRWYYNGWHYWFFLPGKYTVIAEGENYKTIGTRQITLGSGQIIRSQAEAIRTIMNTREVYLLTIAGWMNIKIDPGSVIMYDNRQEGVEIEFTATIGSKEISYDTGLTPVPVIPITPAPYRGKGMLYNWYSVDTGILPPIGWHIPSLVEFQTLADYLGAGGDYSTNNIGGKLKTTGFIDWNSPNTGATNEVGFNGMSSGSRGASFSGLGLTLIFWTSYVPFPNTGSIAQLIANDDYIQCPNGVGQSRYYGYSVRPIKDNLISADCIDIDGNNYGNVLIGNQIWAGANLKVSRYNDGSPIPEETNDASWAALITGARCWYNNIPE